MTGRRGVGAKSLLRDNRPFRWLWCARSVSFLGDSLGLVALLLYVADTTEGHKKYYRTVIRENMERSGLR